jgi:hypothetical protein
LKLQWFSSPIHGKKQKGRTAMSHTYFMLEQAELQMKRDGDEAD